jgi:hypothetical protein
MVHLVRTGKIVDKLQDILNEVGITEGTFKLKYLSVFDHDMVDVHFDAKTFVQFDKLNRLDDRGFKHINVWYHNDTFVDEKGIERPIFGLEADITELYNGLQTTINIEQLKNKSA